LKPEGWTPPDIDGVLEKSHIEYICELTQEIM